MSKTSSDKTEWLPKLCCRCGQPVRVSRQSFGCSFAGAGTVDRPVPQVWHVRCVAGAGQAAA